MDFRARRHRVVQNSAQNRLPLLLHTKKQKHDKQDVWNVMKPSKGRPLIRRLTTVR